MPTVTLNKEVFEKLVGKKLELDELKDRISMLGTDLESIEGNEITVEVFPNRPDMLSEQGFARAFSSFIGEKTGLREYSIHRSGQQVIIDPSVTMRPYTMCAIVKNLKFTDERIREVMQIQEKLAKTHGRSRVKSAYGLYPSDSIAFPVKYVAKDPKGVQFWPLGFPGPVDASTVGELHPKGKEYQHITEGWKKYPFFEDANGKLLCMLPYTNSHDTGKVELNTKNVFIECSGTDLQNVTVALNIFITMLSDMGGEIHGLEMVYPNKTIEVDLSPTKMELDVNYVNRILGLSLSSEETGTLLERMGHGYRDGTVLIPAYRADIMHPIDLVEEVAIAYGYENFVPEIPNVATIGEIAPINVFLKRVGTILAGAGYLECITFHISNKEFLNDRMRVNLPFIQLENSLSIDYDILRSWMLPSLMDVLSRNKHYEYPQKLFDIGTVFKENKEYETGVEEFVRLAVVLSDTTADYTEARQVLDYLFRMLGVEYSIVSTEHESFIPGRVGRVSIGQNNVAYIGELHPEVLENWQLENPVVGFELNLTELFLSLNQHHNR